MMITRRELLESAATSVALSLSASALADTGQSAKPDNTAGAGDEPIVHRSRPPARKILAAAVNRLSPDEATSFAAMQGLINREQPRVYLVYDAEDVHWLNWLKERGDVDTVEWVGRYDIYQRYRDLFKGCIVTDPDLTSTVNVGMLMAGLNNCLLVSPDLVPAFGLPVKEDLRGRWKRNVDAYRWAYTNLFPSASQRVLAHLFPYGPRLRDYMTEFNVFTFWLSGLQNEEGRAEIEFARELFQRVGPNKPVLGWWDSHGRGKPSGISEGDGVDLISGYGLFCDCMDWDGHCEGTSNVSVHSGTRATLRQKPAPPAPKLEGKVYYSFIRTDGDGTNFWRQEFLSRFWDADRGKVAVNWPVGPMACDFIPDIMDWFYKNASPNDYFTAAVSGVGYLHESIYGAKLPADVRKKAFAEFLRLTGRYMKRMDLHHLHTHTTKSDALAAEYASIEGMQGLFLNYNREPDTTAENATKTINGVPVFRSIILGSKFYGSKWSDIIAGAQAQAREYTPARRPAFLHFTASNWHAGPGTEMETVGILRKIRDDLGSEYVAVRADHLAQLYKEANR
jgi:hypothetical protein